MPARKKTWFAVLGLLDWRPMSGYDIKKLIAMGLAHFWSESYGALYPTLNQLVAAGLVTRRSDRRGGKRPRYVFSITPRGRGELRQWLRAPTEPPGVRNEMLLKLFLAPARPPAETVKLLTSYRAQQLERRREYVESERVLRSALERDELPRELGSILAGGVPRSPRGTSRQLLAFLLTLRHGVHVTEARLAWCEEALGLLRGEGNVRRATRAAEE